KQEIALALTRHGRPHWTDADFQRLLFALGGAGYGWLRPEGVRRELENMAAAWDSRPPPALARRAKPSAPPAAARQASAGPVTSPPTSARTSGPSGAVGRMRNGGGPSRRTAPDVTESTP